MDAYFLRGSEGEILLVFRSSDPETILGIITRLAACRDREIRPAAQELELEFYRRQENNNGSPRDTGKVESRHKKKGSNGRRGNAK